MFRPVYVVLFYVSSCFSMEIRFAQHNNIFDGRYEITGSLENHHTTSLIECNMKCSFKKECLTFYYNSLIQQCILHRDSYTLPSRMGTGWKLYYTNDEYNDERNGRCPSTDGFMYYKRLDLCFNLNTPMTINFPVIKSFCSQMSAELIRIDSPEKQQFIEFITGTNKTIERICIQGTDKITPLIWTFDDGTLMTYFNWEEASSLEPDGGQGNIEMYTGYKWHDLYDVSSNPCLPICERK